MAKIGPEDLDKIAERMKKIMSLREGAGKAKITVHMGTCGISAGARTIMSAVMKCIDESGRDDILVSASGCAGLCSREPMITVELEGKAPVKYIDLTVLKIDKIFKEYVIGGNIVTEYALAIGSEQTL